MISTKTKLLGLEVGILCCIIYILLLIRLFPLFLLLPRYTLVKKGLQLSATFKKAPFNRHFWLKAHLNVKRESCSAHTLHSLAHVSDLFSTTDSHKYNINF